MIKIETIRGSGTNVVVNGDLVQLVDEVITAVDAVIQLFPEEAQNDVLSKIPELVMMRRMFCQSKTKVDMTILNKILGDDNADR